MSIEARASSSNLSASVLTFLIADVRGWTRFTSERGDEAAAELASRLADLADDVVEGYDGKVIELRGDEVLAVFSSARQALRAAASLSTRFQTEIAPGLPIDIGIGLDAGDAISVRGGYRGGALNLAARLQSLASGEVFASQTVISLARRTDGLAYVDRGQVKVKGLADPIRVIQVVPDDSVPENPAKFTVEGPAPIQLPAPLTSFVGREDEIATIHGLLSRDDVRLLTLTGPGGTGKTRLSMHVAARLKGRFVHGVFFVPLDAISDPELLGSEIASVLGVKESGDVSIVDALVDYLRDKSALLVLDTFEHLLGASTLPAQLLARCPALTIVVTSRSVLHISGEVEYPVPPLRVPGEGSTMSVEEIARYEAVELFVRRAEAVRPGFALTVETAPVVAEICRRLDGLPLAIELAAARAKLFSPSVLLSRLDNRLKLLTGGARDLPAHQQTLRSTIDWSYRLLDESERALFARLAVFGGGCTLEAAAEVCDPTGDLPIDIVDGVASLIDKSLLRYDGDPEPRVVMLDTLREYAEERLDESGDAPGVRSRHRAWAAGLASEAEPHWFATEQGVWLDRLEREHGNLRTALDSALLDGDPAQGLRTAVAVWRFWESRGHLSEGRRRLEEFLARVPDAESVLRSRALEGVGWLAALQGDYESAIACLDAGLAAARETGDATATAALLTTLGALSQVQGAYLEAIALYEESVGVSEAASDFLGAARPRHNLATLAYAQGNYTRAEAMFRRNVDEVRLSGNDRILAGSLEGLALTLWSRGEPLQGIPLLEESLAIARQLGDQRQVASALDNLGCLFMDRSELERARPLLEEARDLALDMGDRFRTVACLESLGTLALLLEDLGWAQAVLLEGLELASSAGYKHFMPGFLEQLAGVRVAEGRMETAAALLGAADATREGLGHPRPAEEDAAYQSKVQAARSALGTAWDAAWRRGQSLSPEQVVAEETGRSTGA